MSNLNLEKFVTEELIVVIAKKLLASESEINCFNYIEKLTVGQLKKLRAFLLCQTKEINNSLSLLSLLVASLAISIPFIESIKYISKAIYILPISITVGIVLFVFNNGISLLKDNDSHNNKIKYLIYIVDMEIQKKSTQ